MSDPLRPRRVAAAILGRVIREGAYSNVLLGTETAGLEPAESARVKALVYGSIRTLPDLERHIQAGSRRPLKTIEDDILDLLRIAAFEIRYSEVPSPVAVSVGVDLVKEKRPKAASMANAVLRRVAEAETASQLGLEFPHWLVTRLTSIWEPTEIEAFSLASANEAPRVGRLRPGADGDATPIPGVPGAFELPPGPVGDGYQIQDTASIAVGNAVNAEPGMRVLDVSAAPGGKTIHLLDQVGAKGVVVAADSHARRTRTSQKRAPEALWVNADGRQPPFRPGSFDRVLVDAPCSGIGTLRRRPEIIHRIRSEDVDTLARIQHQIVASSIPLLAPGGELIYSVCTVTPEETVGVVSGLGFVDPGTPGQLLGDGRLMTPHGTGSDGMFIARYRN